MIPTAYNKISYEAANIQPSKTYRLAGGHIQGFIDGTEALKQTVFCILSTQRYIHAIYSQNYGFDRDALIGAEAPLVYAKIKDNIVDALMQDDRISAVSDFSFSSPEKKSVLVAFVVTGTTGAETEMEALVDV